MQTAKHHQRVEIDVRISAAETDERRGDDSEEVSYTERLRLSMVCSVNKSNDITQVRSRCQLVGIRSET